MEGTAHQAELVEGGVMHIRGAIMDLERHFQLATSLGGTEQGEGNPGLDKQGIVPWHPNGAPFELTIPKVSITLALLSQGLSFVLAAIRINRCKRCGRNSIWKGGGGGGSLQRPLFSLEMEGV